MCSPCCKARAVEECRRSPFPCVRQEILVQLLSSPQCVCLTVLGTHRSRLILRTFRHLTAALELRLWAPATGSFCAEGAERSAPWRRCRPTESWVTPQKQLQYFHSEDEMLSWLSTQLILAAHSSLKFDGSAKGVKLCSVTEGLFPPCYFASNNRRKSYSGVKREKVIVEWKEKFRDVDNKFSPNFQYHLFLISSGYQWIHAYQKLCTQSPAQVQLLLCTIVV